MLQNHLKLAIRKLRGNGRYLVINVLGLGFALGFCILADLNYRFAHSFDNWHAARERIFRVEPVKESNDAQYGVCPAALGPLAATESGVEAFTRIDARGVILKHGDDVFSENVHFADPNFFQVFDFEVISGSASLDDRSTVLISDKMAEKYFGKQNPVGQTLLFYADQPERKTLTISGVVRSQLKNSSIRFSFLTHLDNQLEDDHPVDYTNWKWQVDAVFLLLKNPSDAPAVTAGLQAFTTPQNIAVPDWKIKRFTLEPLSTLALNAQSLRWNNLWPSLPPAAVWGNLIMAVLLLLTAALNFANMTIAAGNRRLREMGVRKAMGATQGQLMRQLLIEAMLVCVLATGLGIILAYPICDWFNTMWKFTNLVVDYSDPALLAYLGVVVLFTTLLAGSYPAFYVSAFRPASIFRGSLQFGGGNMFSRIMMGLQVTISLMAVVTGLSFAQNAEYNRTADVGFERENILGVYLNDDASYRVFRDAVKDLPGVQATAGARHLPGFGFANIEFNFQGKSAESCLYEIGNGVHELMGLRLATGEWPVPAGDTSGSTEILVNETFVREIGESKPLLGEQITYKGQSFRIAGVVHDFMTNTPFRPISPSVLRPMPANTYRNCVVKTAPGKQVQVMAAMENQWKQLFPYRPFNGFYQNEVLREAVEVSDNIAGSMGVFSIVAILLSVTGLFSLVSLNVLRRMREVAVRRVLGASSGHITWILNKNYLWIFAAAVTIGCFSGRYLALALMNSIFKYNVGVQPGALAWSTFGVLTVAAVTIGLKVWQALRVNPADVLRGD